jgi:hypothetical protein
MILTVKIVLLAQIAQPNVYFRWRTDDAIMWLMSPADENRGA